MTAYLHRRFPDLAATLPHLSLSARPTPVRELAGLGVWLKEDGRFGDGGWGGNKVRKLEWLIPDARRRGRRAILTFGGLGTNWGLATALYAREHGLTTALALVDQPVDDHVRAQLARLEASGARIYRTRTKARTVAALPWLLTRNARGGKPPYLLPAGGSSPLGALGYVEAALEIAGQVEDGMLPEPAHVVVPIGTGGTAAGLAVGLRLAGLRSRVVGVVVNDQLRLDPSVLGRLARRTAGLLKKRGAELGGPRFGPEAFDLTRDQIGGGYGHRTAAAEAAAARAAGDGLSLDPVYTAKAMAGLLALREAGRLTGPVLFVHTDGPR
ncbi:MAG: pyridoxal-phosphate dependent enzyme [Solirubrobacterales bacterium]